MGEKTKIRFFGVQAAPYSGAARDGCKPEDPKAVGWHVVVGGSQCSLDTIEDFVKHFESFLNTAYRAGVEDTKADIRERLGL